jgi:hypothetical protein
VDETAALLHPEPEPSAAGARDRALVLHLCASGLRGGGG